jgi:LysM repeat protein
MAERTITRKARSKWPRLIVAAGVAGMLSIALTACFLFPGTTATSAKHSARPHASPTASETPTVAPTTPLPTASATAPNPAISHLATPGPVDNAFPAPTISAIPAGTVVAVGNVASPKGSIHFHYAVVSNGNGTYSAHYSGFTSTVPVPVSVTLLQAAPNVGDGLTYKGVGDHRLGGPDKTAAPASSAPLASTGPPSYLGSMVTYSSATSAANVPIELGPNKVLAVTAVHWSIPARRTNVHPVDKGKRSYAAGTVTAKTTSGAPRRYRVASGDVTAVVAARFGISVQDLIFLNRDLEVFGDQQYLYSGTTLNLDPNEL